MKVLAVLLCAGCLHAQPIALKTPRDNFAPSVLDVSHLVEAPAGKHGFVTRRGERFVFADGTPVRFWGAQINLWDKEQIDYTARRMRKLGINVARLHGLNNLNAKGRKSIRDYDEEAFERLDYTIAALQRNGIYLILDADYPNTVPFGSEDRIPGVLPEGGVAPMAEFFNDRATELRIGRMVDVFGRTNKFTGKRYCDDPAIALAEIHNESSLFFYAVDGMRPVFRDQLAQAFRDWLRGRYRNTGNLRTAWRVRDRDALAQGEGIDGAEKLELIRIGSFRAKTLEQHPEWEKRGQDQLRFYLDLETRYYARAAKALRELGVKVPIVGTNWVGGGFTNRIHMYGQTGLDYIDRHGYWDHPVGEGNLKWRIDTCRFHNLPMVKDLSPGEDPQQENNVGNLVTAKAWQRVFGFPLTISEWNTCLPNRYSLEGTGVMTAYGLLQGWNGMLQFALSSPDWPAGLSNRSFDLYGNPPQILQFPAVAMMWHRGDVREGPIVGEIRYSPHTLFDFTDERLPVPAAAALVGKVGYRFDESRSTTLPVGRYWDAGKKIARSATGELEWNAGAGFVTIDTPRTQAVIGFVSAQPHKLRDATLELKGEFGAVYVTAADGMKPLSQAGRILVTAVGPARNSGMQYEETSEKSPRHGVNLWRVSQLGSGPALIETVTGTVSLRTTQKLRAWALDANGARIREVPLKTGGGVATLTLDSTHEAVYYELSVK